MGICCKGSNGSASVGMRSSETNRTVLNVFHALDNVVLRAIACLLVLLTQALERRTYWAHSSWPLREIVVAL